MALPSNLPSKRPSFLLASYSAPSTSQAQPERTHTFSHPLSTSLSRSLDNSSTTPAKTAYLSELRGAVSTLQTEINEFLTARMDEDNNINRQASGSVNMAQTERERREEENYGEEVLDDED
ncbi:hypothetical protein I7I51_03302 [Histoplasma capsulatum]|uniref:EKC/KEOPS complex subunit GON7 n=1 Tax=Ajellomyces capsulatus TaxID=5037 RepID=A0A8A1M774_AJECA|nr:hypothetical protein I7I51_03302 [Histoplasma capsulatum]